MEYSKEDLMEAKKQILGVGENMGTEESKKIWEENAQFWDNEGNKIHTDSRFVLGRQEIVPMLFSEDEQEWGKITIKIREYLKASMWLRQKLIPRCKEIDDFYKNKPVHEWVNFLHENYDMQKLYVNKEWNNKKIRCFRNICRSMIAEDVPY